MIENAMLKHFRNCRRITELSSLSQEQPLTFYQKVNVKMHLRFCPNCQAFEQNNRMLKQMIKAHKAADRDNQTAP